MSKANIGARKKRTAVPADRHKRAVAYRHRTYSDTVKVKSILEDVLLKEAIPAVQKEETAAEAEVVSSEPEAAEKPAKVSFFDRFRKKNKQTVPAAEEKVSEPEAIGESSEPEGITEPEVIEEPEKIEEPAETVEEPAVIAEPAEEEEEEKKSIFGGVVNAARARKAEKKAQLDWEADLPKIGVLRMLLFPASAIDRENVVEGPVFGSFASFWMNLIKWPCIAAAFVLPVYMYINEKSISVISMNFSKASLLTVQLAAFGFICEYLMIWILDILGNIFRRAIEKRKLVSSVSRGSLGIAFIYVAAALVMYFKGYAFGFAALTAATVYSISLVGYGIDRCMRLNKTIQSIVMLVLSALFAWGGYQYIAFMAPDVIRMIQYLANI